MCAAAASVTGPPAWRLDKVSAYMTLYTALVTIAKAAAPMVPFMAEAIYQNLVRSIDQTAPESIHLCDFPTVEENAGSTKSWRARWTRCSASWTLGRAARNGANRKNRQPLAEMYVKADKDAGRLLYGYHPGGAEYQGGHLRRGAWRALSATTSSRS